MQIKSIPMGLFEKKKNNNILDMIPFRVVENFTENNGLVTLNLPRFKSPAFSKWVLPKGKSPYIEVKLDKNGSRVWLQINGNRNLQQICDIIRTALSEGQEIPDLEERTAKFITELYKSRFIKFMEEKL
ncbi:MAG: PqqD family protein [Bacteroidales bacterium]|nr:PqqD family protein [Bacteroidales bacterium]